MIQELCRVTDNRNVASNIHVLSFCSPGIAAALSPGQFVNIRVSESLQPLLRRPFSIYHRDGDTLRIVFNVIGPGTTILSAKNPGDTLDIIGPLGGSYGIDGSFDTALLVAGGLGVAPLPLLTQAVRGKKELRTFLGARTQDQLLTGLLENVDVATDDGTRGYRGTVVALLRSSLQREQWARPKIFACGPNAMLAELSRFAEEFRIPCEVSVESAMACGVGICQGCPIETTEGKYALICKDGTVFDTRTIRIR